MIRRTPLLLASFFLPALLAAPVLAEEPREILLRSLNPTRTTYVGDQVTEVSRPNGRRTRVQQRVYRSGNQLRINYPTGQVLYDDGEKQQLYLPRLGVVEQGPSRLSGERIRLQRGMLARRSRLQVEQGPDETVAGRPAYVLSIRDRQGKLPTRKVWVDRETYVQLRLDETQPARAQTSTQFVSLSYTDPPTGMLPFTPPAGVRVVPRGQGRPIPEARAALLARPWGGPLRPAYVPSGFSSTGFFLHRFQGKDVLVAVYRNDATNQNLSVFQGPAMGMDGIGRMARPPRLRVLTGRRGRADVAVVAPLPEAELKKVMDSIPE